MQTWCKFAYLTTRGNTYSDNVCIAAPVSSLNLRLTYCDLYPRQHYPYVLPVLCFHLFFPSFPSLLPCPYFLILVVFCVCVLVLLLLLLFGLEAGLQLETLLPLPPRCGAGITDVYHCIQLFDTHQDLSKALTIIYFFVKRQSQIVLWMTHVPGLSTYASCLEHCLLCSNSAEDGISSA